MGTVSVGAVQRPIQGETLSGDAYWVFEQPSFVIVAVVDGLGHGPEAHLAAQKALETMQARPDRSAEAHLEACHRGLKHTRGAVIGIARVDLAQGLLTYAGLGNIEARIVGADKVRHPISVNGIVGHQVRKLRTETFPFAPGDLLVMHSDGISDRFTLLPTARTQEPQMLALQLVNGHGRAGDDQVLVVVRRDP